MNGATFSMRSRLLALGVLLAGGTAALLVKLHGQPGGPDLASGEQVMEGRAAPQRPTSEPPASSREAATAVEVPALQSVSAWTIPGNAEEFASLVAWMRTLPREEMLLLTNGDYDFRDSELIRMLQSLEGPWVVEAMAESALLESDPLLKATLVEGLAGAVRFSRLEDEHLMPALEALLPQFLDNEDDPYKVGRDLISNLWMGCEVQKEDYVAKAKGLLASSTNSLLLITGYDMMSGAPGGLDVLRDVIVDHPSPEGRMGALEGIRQAGQGDRMDENEVARLGLKALANERNRRNQVLLVELLGSTGGSAGLAVLKGLVEDPRHRLQAEAATTLAVHMEPTKARAVLEDALAASTEKEERATLYRALATIPGPEGAAKVLAVATDSTATPEERLSSLRGLWNAEVTASMRPEISRIVTEEKDPALRVEAMKMLFFSGATGELPDLRALATDDSDPKVRAQAVALAAMQEGDDVRGWLEERLLTDRSKEVKTEALGAMVMHAHLAGSPEKTAEYLHLARKMTDDEETRQLIEQGEALLADQDPRKLDLGLRGQAETWAMFAKYTSGTSARQFEQQAKLLEHFAAALKAGNQ